MEDAPRHTTSTPWRLETNYMAGGALGSTSKTHGTLLKRSYRCVLPAEGFVVAVIFNQLELV